MPLDLEDKLELLKQAREAQNNAYAPYSGFMAFPCGICRQVISELAGEARIILQNSKGEMREYGLKELLPESFCLKK